VSLVHGQIVDGKDRILCADSDAVSAVDAFIGMDEDLGDGSRSGIVDRGRNGSGGAFCYTNEVQCASIGDDISHDENSLMIPWNASLPSLGNAPPNFEATGLSAL
jgi:hypothetical protein